MTMSTHNKTAKFRPMAKYYAGSRTALCILATTLVCAASLRSQVTEGGEQANNSKPKLAHVYQNAHILSNRGTHTVVPMHSIIYQPTKNQSKVVEIPSGKFRFWPDFLPQNRDWIHTFEVTLDQAKGKKPIPAAKLEEFAKINRTVIATYRKNPISVRPPKNDDSSSQKENKE